MYKETNQKRSRLETMNVILAISKGGIKKTHIMYKANLSHIQLTKYLTVLTSKGLLTTEMGLYVTTEKGLAFVEKFRALQSLMGETDEENQNLSSLYLINMKPEQSDKQTQYSTVSRSFTVRT